MKLKEISVSFSSTINTGNYESMRFESSIISTLEENDDYKKCFSECEVSEKVLKIKKIKEKKNNEIT